MLKMAKNMTANGEFKTDTTKNQKVVALTTELVKMKNCLKNADHRLNNGSKGNRNGTKKTTLEGIKPDDLWRITKKSDTITHDGVEYTSCPHHKSKDCSVEVRYMKAPHNHNEQAESRKQKDSSQWKRRKDNQGASSDATTPDGIPSQSSLKNSKSLKLDLNQKLATALVTHHHMTQKEDDEIFKAAYNAAESSLNWKDRNWVVGPWVTQIF